MQKIYLVRLSDDERQTCLAIIKQLQGSSQKVRRAHILLKADINGPHWTDQDIADAYLSENHHSKKFTAIERLYLPITAMSINAGLETFPRHEFQKL